MRTVSAVAVAATIMLAMGCRREPTPVQHTSADYQKQIDNVKADEKMPPNIKAMVIGQLENQKRQADSRSKGG